MSTGQQYMDKPPMGGYPPAQGGPPAYTDGPLPGQGYPPQGYPQAAPTHPGYQTGQLQQAATTVTISQPATQVVVVGNCPVCHAGVLQDRYTACGVILAVIFFPIGLLFCLMMKERVCMHCGITFGS